MHIDKQKQKEREIYRKLDKTTIVIDSGYG